MREEIIFENHKKYRGSLVFAKLITPSGVCKVEKRGDYGWNSFKITKQEYEYITNRKKAEELWVWHHFGVNASFDKKHPVYGKSAMEIFKEQPLLTPTTATKYGERNGLRSRSIAHNTLVD